MALSNKHTKVATLPDDPNYEVGSGEWNAEHTVLVADKSFVGKSTAGAGAVSEIDMTTAKAMLALTAADVGAAPALGVDDNYVTDAEKVVIGNTSGTNTGDAATPAETATTIGALIGGSADATPNDTDFVATSLTAAGILKKITWTNVVTYIKNKLISLGFMREVLTANRTYYVRTDGSNSNTGLVNNAGGAFLTTQKAIDVVNATLDTAGYTVTIQHSDGTYTTPIVAKDIIGGGNIVIQGNTGNKSAVIISTTSANCFLHFVFGLYTLQYLRLTTTTGGSCMQANSINSVIYYKEIDFGPSAAHHIIAYAGGQVSCIGAYAITGGCPNGCHFFDNYGGLLVIATVTITITGTLSFNVFAYASMPSSMRATSITWAGSYTVTGKRYEVDTNAAIITFGGGPNVFPGDVAGTTASGGQYI